MYRIQQFAKLAHVTVRTLHHYDRIGLLQPRLRSEGGYRLYCNEDVVQLERIAVLRYLGLSLKQIAEVLHDGEEALATTLATQAAVLRDRRDGMSRVLQAVEHAQQQVQAGTLPDWPLYQSILKEIQMQEQQDWPQKYFSPDAQKALEERQANFTLEMQRETGLAWKQMYEEVEAAIANHIAITSAEARTLADRWVALIQQFTGGDPRIWQGLQRLYDDQPNWPAEQQQAHGVKPELASWIRAVQGAR